MPTHHGQLLVDRCLPESHGRLLAFVHLGDTRIPHRRIGAAEADGSRERVCVIGRGETLDLAPFSKAAAIHRHEHRIPDATA